MNDEFAKIQVIADALVSGWPKSPRRAQGAMTGNSCRGARMVGAEKAYHKHLLESDNSSPYLVVTADELHDARATADDLRNEGMSAWSSVQCGERAGTLELHKSTVGPPTPRVQRITEKLRRVLAELA
jgi:hypothetical protein